MTPLTLEQLIAGPPYPAAPTQTTPSTPAAAVPTETSPLTTITTVYNEAQAKREASSHHHASATPAASRYGRYVRLPQPRTDYQSFSHNQATADALREEEREAEREVSCAAKVACVLVCVLGVMLFVYLLNQDRPKHHSRGIII